MAPAPVMDESDLITIRFKVQPCHHGWRLDRFVKARIPRLSRNRIQQMIRSQSDLGAQALRPAARVRTGQLVELLRPAPEEPDVPMYYTVLHRDQALLAICKPAGLPVHATARFHRNTLTALLYRDFEGQVVPQMAHRLDRETSGVMLLGRTPEAGAALKRAFRERRVHKRYLAVVAGQPPEDSWTVELPLGPDIESGIRVKMGVMQQGGLPARTRFCTRARRGGHALVEAFPETGRQHQIRAHLGACGLPIVGDKLYGEAPCLLEYLETGWTESLQQRLQLPRQALHAAAVSFPHPATGQQTTVECPLSEDLQAFWDGLEAME